jgi:hypothetical protein
MCMFCKSLFVLLYFFILAVCSYSIYGFWLPPLVSSNSSFRSTSVLLVRYVLLIFLTFCVVFLIYLPSSYVSCIPNVFSNVYFRFILTLMCFVLDSHCVYAIRISLRVVIVTYHMKCMCVNNNKKRWSRKAYLSESHELFSALSRIRSLIGCHFVLFLLDIAWSILCRFMAFGYSFWYL